MKGEFLRAENGEFISGDEKIMLRGFSVGSWMNLESFMTGIPGTEKQIRRAYTEAYGRDNADRFFDDFLASFINEDDFILLKSLGINVLRLPFNHRHFEDDQAPGKYSLEGFRHLDRVIGLCRKYGIYAILDMHSSPGGQNPDSHGGGGTGTSEFWEDASLRERIVNLWEFIARRYAGEEAVAGYDILNEPFLVADIDAFNDFYDRTVRTIRKADNNHILFSEGDDWAKDFSVFRHLGGYQQAISFHFYPGQHVPVSLEKEERKAVLERKISYFTGLREKTGMPLWVGETGGYFPGNLLQEGVGLVRDCLDIFEKHRISWTIWSYKDAGAMGMIYPKEDTQWMSMASGYRRQWQLKSRSNPTIAREVFDMLEEKFGYAIGEKMREQLKFRIFALLNELHVQKLVKPTLQAIPWEEMKTYPGSFLLENCEGSEEIAGLVKSYTGNEADLKTN